MLRKFSNIKIDALIGVSGKSSVNTVSLCEQQVGMDHRKAQRLARSVGFEELRVIYPPLTAADACCAGAKVLFEKLSLAPSEIDALIMVTQSPDYLIPATSYGMQHRLGLSSECYLMDLTQGCSGFVNGLFAACGLIASGIAKRVLLCAGDVLAGMLMRSQADLDQKANSALFGDGAGVALITASDAKTSYFSIQNNGESADTIISQYLGFKYRFSDDFDPEMVKTLHGSSIDGGKLADYMLRVVKDDLSRLRRYSGTEYDDLSYCIAHQANRTLMSALADVSGMRPGFMPFLAAKTGNTSSASIPLALSENRSMLPEIKNKMTLLCGFGVGLSVASAVVDLSATQIIDPLYI